MSSNISRRNLLLSSASFSVLFAAGLSVKAQPAITVDQFRAVSARLTGSDVADLDSGVARQFLDGLVSIGRGPGLSLLESDPAVTTGTVADDIVAAWYSGTYETDTGEKLAAFNDALVWNALDFTKPFGSCGGETGYWAEPPAT